MMEEELRGCFFSRLRPTGLRPFWGSITQLVIKTVILTDTCGSNFVQEKEIRQPRTSVKRCHYKCGAKGGGTQAKRVPYSALKELLKVLKSAQDACIKEAHKEKKSLSLEHRPLPGFAVGPHSVPLTLDANYWRRVRCCDNERQFP